MYACILASLMATFEALDGFLINLAWNLGRYRPTQKSTE
jgi:hypothetical protein